LFDLTPKFVEQPQKKHEQPSSMNHATFDGGEATGEDDAEPHVEIVKEVLNEFGSKLVELATPLWEIQVSALKEQESRDDDWKKKDWRNAGGKKQFDWTTKRH
jgi:hypothetical protein